MNLKQKDLKHATSSFLGFYLYTLLIPFGKFVFVTQRNCVATEQRH